ncbi:MAG TPA: hypothetical protein VL096_12965 [Pirellulaceae bacterium]|nr:hypothetical protein [Pirellulaceae bacterium]
MLITPRGQHYRGFAISMEASARRFGVANAGLMHSAKPIANGLARQRTRD